MTSFAPRLMLLLLCATALTGCATPDNAQAAGATADAAKPSALVGPPGDLDSSIRQAQLLRVAGQYDQAIHILSQLMLVASDDPRVVGEYGKTLAEQGRPTEAVQFLGRATELSSNDWTLYSALGVADDQLGDQPSARIAYEHALVLKPGEPSVLNNYALSRLLANDPVMARQLIARAQIAGGASDPKIARNIALINQLAPETPEASAATPGIAYAVQKPAPAVMAASAPTTKPATAVASAAPTGAPRPLVTQALPVLKLPTPPTAKGVVMQTVPVDPLDGPVKSRTAKTAKPAHVAIVTVPVTAKPDATKPAKPTPVKAADVKPVPAKTADAKPVAKPAKPDVKARNAVPALRMTADAGSP